MKPKTKWILLSILAYLLFAGCGLGFGFLDPAKISWPWTAFWLIAALGIAYYLGFKNLIFERTMYYAKQLNLTKADLVTMLPELSGRQEVPDPQKRHWLSPVFNFSLQNLNILDRQLAQLAQTKGIKPFD
ncbi:hypothetical protein OXT66_01980 [Lentilactobacillus senioris]|uniref:hypothetical protein n=1 Tax=Lentilactobacillus senioris TaxID=931534 RepID=UPI00227DC61B|nr:hypothetical protein [Lentilactobacillus senioris]MCY9806315.1 hypothetical protein [Lentilactobacillus senioris]